MAVTRIRRNVFGYVTLVTNGVMRKRSPGALPRRPTQRPLTVLAVREAPGLDALAAAGCRIVQADPPPLSAGFRQRHSRQSQHARAPFTKGNKPAFHDPLDNFAKLRLWQLEEFDRVVFLDADAIVIHNIDRLFGYPEFAAAPNLYGSLADFHRLNSGVFVPTFPPHLRRHARALDQPDAFCAPPTYLQTYFGLALPASTTHLQYVGSACRNCGSGTPSA